MVRNTTGTRHEKKFSLVEKYAPWTRDLNRLLGPGSALYRHSVRVTQSSRKRNRKTVHLTPTNVGARAVDGTRTDCSFIRPKAMGAGVAADTIPPKNIDSRVASCVDV
ncbi:hypothetical protein Q7P36_004059 [Cladosporium allicinum]